MSRGTKYTFSDFKKYAKENTKEIKKEFPKAIIMESFILVGVGDNNFTIFVTEYFLNDKLEDKRTVL